MAVMPFFLNKFSRFRVILDRMLEKLGTLKFKSLQRLGSSHRLSALEARTHAQKSLAPGWSHGP